MTWTPSGKHLIAGEWVQSASTFTSYPYQGKSHQFSAGTKEEVKKACEKADEAFWSYGYLSRQERSRFLVKIAEAIEKRMDALVNIAHEETAKPKAGLEGETARTINQLKMFADHILNDDYLDYRHDEALPERTPPRPDLIMVQRPVGPVGVFGASNFPIAFSTAGGDTAAALAAGCPVVVKGHPAHPGTGEIVAEAINEAREACEIHPGVFSFVQGNTNEVGEALALDPHIKAIGFTGSLGGGRALYNLCASREVPIPFFGELGSINPVFILPEKAKKDIASIATDWVASLTLGVGQFCTNPGILILLKESVDTFVETALEALEKVAPQIMLTEGISSSYVRGINDMLKVEGVESLLEHKPTQKREAAPALIRCTAEQFLQNPQLSEEVFGPFGVIVVVEEVDQMLDIARNIHGQLTCTMQMSDDDKPFASKLLRILETKAGRVLANGYPTGVEVCDAMVHGGPYPASTNFGATSVGTLAIRRFIRPVCYQNMKDLVELR